MSGRIWRQLQCDYLEPELDEFWQESCGVIFGGHLSRLAHHVAADLFLKFLEGSGNWRDESERRLAQLSVQKEDWT